jgi:hypothetical protein
MAGSKIKRKSKKKTTRRSKVSARASSYTRKATNTSLPSGLTKLEPDKTVQVLKEIFVEAPVNLCFATLSNQLEHPPRWDPMIINAWPVSDFRGQVGATSQLILNFGGREISSQAVICRYRPNGSISWVITDKPKVREDWRLEPKPRGTVVQLKFACELDGHIIRRLIYKVLHWKKVKNDLDRILVQLKDTIENHKS